MLILSLLLAVRFQRIKVLKSKFKRITSSIGLRADCNKEGIKSNAHTDEKGTCDSYTYSSSHFYNFTYNPFLSFSNSGGAIYFANVKTLTLLDNTFENVAVSNNGGALYFESIGTINLEKNKYWGCKAKYGGCLYFYDTAKLSSTKCININDKFFNDSKASIDGGVIYFENTKIADVTINHCIFNDSQANGKGGGIIFGLFFKSIKFQNSKFLNSSAPDNIGNGGAIYVSNSRVYFDNCTFDLSQCKYNSGGACYFTGLSKLEVNNSHFSNCVAQEYGGAFQILKTSDILFSNNEFRNCSMSKNASNIETRIGGCMNIEGFQPLIFIENIFNDCHAFQRGGAICFVSSTNLEIRKNTFRDCYVEDNYGGAIYASILEGFKTYDNSFINNHAKQYGGAICLKSITEPSLSTRFTRDKFTECHTNEFGGSIYIDDSKTLNINVINLSFTKCYNLGTNGGGVIYLDTINKITFDGIKCIDCNSTIRGGFIYTKKVQTGIEATRSDFLNCQAPSGGVFYVDSYSGTSPPVIYVDFTECNFTNCKSSTNMGGCLYLDKYVMTIYIYCSNFVNCTSTTYGAAIYYHYTYMLKSDEITLGFTDNNFIDCNSGTYGTVCIDSKKVDTGQFVNNNFINCSADNPDGIGGGFMTLTDNYGNFYFIKCSFINCYAPAKFGALGFQIDVASDDNSSLIKFNGCLFDNCSSQSASCIGTLTPQTAKKSAINLVIDENSTFRSIKGEGNRYAIVTSLSDVKIKNTAFEHITIGVLNSNDKTMNISDCSFFMCKSVPKLINCESLIRFIMYDTVFSNCVNCLNINSTGIIFISALTINETDDTYQSKSSFTCDRYTINGLWLQNNLETIEVNVAKDVIIDRGSFINSEKNIIINGATTSKMEVTNFLAENSLMFAVNSISNFSISNCDITYKVEESLGTKNKIISTTSRFYSVANCTFSVDNVTPIEFAIGSYNGQMDNCTHIGENSAIIVGSDLTVKNCEFGSKGKSFDITGTSGLLKLFDDTNCFRNKNFATAIGNGKVTDKTGITRITEFNANNNKCKELPASPIFSYSMMFYPSEIFSNSETKNIPTETNLITNGETSQTYERIPTSIFHEQTDTATEFYVANIFIESSIDRESSDAPVIEMKDTSADEATILATEEIQEPTSVQIITNTPIADIRTSQSQLIAITATHELITIPSSIYDEQTTQIITPTVIQVVETSEINHQTSIMITNTEEQPPVNSIPDISPTVQEIIDQTTNYHQNIILTTHYNYNVKRTSIEQGEIKTSIEKVDQTTISPEVVVSSQVKIDEKQTSAKNEEIKTDLTSIEKVYQATTEQNNILTTQAKIEEKQTSIEHEEIEVVPTSIEKSDQTTNVQKAKLTTHTKPDEKQTSIKHEEVNPTSIEKIELMTKNSIKQTIIDNEKVKLTSKVDHDGIKTHIEDEPEANVGDAGKSVSTGVIAGAAVGAVVVIIIVIVVIYIAICRKKKNRKTSSIDNIETEFETMSSSLSNSSHIEQMEFRTAYVTQEMPTNWGNVADALDDNDFIDNDTHFIDDDSN